MVGVSDAVLAILTRAPSSGGKRRLFQALGMPPDAELLRALLLDTLDGTALPDLRRVIAVTPAASCDEVRAMAGAIDVMPQASGDLGERMQATMAALFRQGAAAVALIGSDVPHIAPAAIAELFDLLARDGDALVLGPAADGGYYLLGARRVPAVFAGVEWGSSRVFAHTVRAAVADGFRVHQLSPLSDVDTADELRDAVRGGRAPRTAAWVHTHAPYLLASA
ncbi:MAG: TIGR04282 family arsenosugar biosynthesis glycosyltransferase [Vicinamibacterales bacterium]